MDKSWIVKLLEITAVSIWSPVVFLILLAFRYSQAGNIFAGITHHKLSYFAQTAVLSTQYTDPLYNIFIYYHPLMVFYTKIMPQHFVLFCCVLLFITSFMICMILSEKKVPQLIIIISMTIYGALGYTQVGAMMDTPRLILFFVSLVSAYFLSSNNVFAKGLGVLCSFFILFAGINGAVFFLIVLAIVANRYYWNLFTCIHVVVLLAGGTLFSLAIREALFSIPRSQLQFGFFELGVTGGMSFILILFGAISSVYVWRRENKLYYVAGMLSFGLLAYHMMYAYLLTLLCALAIGTFIAELGKTQWIVSSLKFVVVLAIFCCVFLAFLMQGTSFAQAYPGSNEIKIVSSLKETVPKGTKIMASSQMTSLLEAYNGQRGIEPSFARHHNQSAWQFTRIEELDEYLAEQDVSYIVVDENIKGITGSHSGTLRLLHDRNSFIPAFVAGTIEVYKVVNATT